MDINWSDVFLPNVSLLEIFVRGTAIYLMLFILLRVVLKRESGGLNETNLLVIVLLADAVQNGMAGSYTSVSDAAALVLTILFWSYTLDWLAYHYPWLERIVHSGPLQLVKDGEMLRHNMRKELITRQELMEYLREQGISDIKSVKAAFIENSGKISVIRAEGQQNPNANETTPV